MERNHKDLRTVASVLAKDHTGHPSDTDFEHYHVINQICPSVLITHTAHIILKAQN